MNTPDDQLEDIAIIGMAGRFPGARNIDEFWLNLRNGVESIRFFTEDELLKAGVSRDVLQQPNCVKARGILDDIDLFDAPLFGFTPKEAEITDPQHRLFLESAWTALEDAGCDSTDYPGRIGVYAGSAFSGYLAVVLSNRDVVRNLGGYRTIIGNDKDFLSSMVSYKLDLKGPSIVVQTACSTSLVAVHMACQSLLNGECDMALAGGVSVRLPQKSPYLFQEGGILSPDGHCRAFDADAQGTVGGEGVGVVVVKRLADALRDRDFIRAVIKGSAINNDGSSKVGFTAPSVGGQARVIAEALDLAGVAPETIGYIEAHGTGTELGDPVEVAALSRAFSGTTKRRFCAIGSVKPNIGHLDAAAGVAGLIKTVLSLENNVIPPTLHFKRPNPKIDLKESPFYIQSNLSEWSSSSPRRAGVSSFGIGGTNAHVILEEAPIRETSGTSRPCQLLVLSAKTSEALEKATENLTNYLETNESSALADVAYTLQVGRRTLEHRRALVCRDRADALRVLRDSDPNRLLTSFEKPKFRPVIFMFPGQGTQHVNMTVDLYRHELYFRDLIDECAESLKPGLGLDLREVLYPTLTNLEQARHQLNQTEITQPALFVVEYCVARLLMHWGVKAEAMIGHSLGEYVAACLAGVFTLQDALALIAVRGRMMGGRPEGRMLAVKMSKDDLAPFLNENLSLAAVNSAFQCVVSGSLAAVAELQKRLTEKSIRSHLLQTSHGLHSQSMDAILPPFIQYVEGLKLDSPSIRFVSNVTGAWITATEACSPGYWGKHLRETVQFAGGVKELLQEPDAILLEIGPGRTLCTLAAQQMDSSARQTVLASLPLPKNSCQDLSLSDDNSQTSLLSTLGSLWLAGVKPDWFRFHQGEQRHRVPLPTYPFERKSYWIQPSPVGISASSRLDARPNSSEQIPRAEAEDQITGESRQLEAIMFEQTTISPVKSARRDAISAMLQSIVYELTGMKTGERAVHTNFFDLGVDSLLIIQFTQAIQNRCGLKISYRQLFDDLATLDAVTTYLDRELPADKFSPEPEVEKPADVPVKALAASAGIAASAQTVARTVETRLDQQPSVAQSLPNETQPAVMPLLYPVQNGSQSLSVIPVLQSDPDAHSNGSSLKDLFSDQLRIMSQQLEIMRGLNTSGLVNASLGDAARAETAVVEASERIAQPENGNTTKKADPLPTPMVTPPSSAPASSLPYKPIDKSAKKGLSAKQEQYLEEFTKHYVERTGNSKRIAQESRSLLADSRLSAGFSLVLKELVYPIYGRRSAGSRVWDADGNEYVDIAMGYGVNLFGNAPPFVTEAVQEQLRQGVALAPQLELTGEVATLLCELTGSERVNFCNSGTEAVMGAIRVARTATGRNRIAMFTGSYHGWSDGTLARPLNLNGQIRSLPGAPGVNPGALEDVILLEYGSPQSLEILKTHAHELAAVLVEPVQSRRPDLQPREFLHELRELTARSGSALIFDEMITGFRIHPGGAQHWFGVRADLVTYGKIVGGGMPIGVIAGRAAFMDAFDGGYWNFGDGSYPPADKTFFAAAFFKHPLSMAAAGAVLTRLKQSGPALQEDLNGKTTNLANTLNEYFERNAPSIHVVHFASLFRFTYSHDFKYSELFSYHLISKGVLTWEGGNFYLSTAHSDDDIKKIVQAVMDTVQDLWRGGFLPDPPDDFGGKPTRSEGVARSSYGQASPGFASASADSGTQASATVSVQAVTFPVKTPTEKTKAIKFSLYYFGNYEPEFRDDKYDLIFKGSRFADQNGFSAVWIPERHFDSFGGFSPNASVLAAALARETERLQIRAGSVVMPLHNPIRVAEEWAMVDNLSKGRVGISFASGWHPNDFVFAPDSYENRREVMDNGIDIVRRLWRGESLPVKGGGPETVNVRLVPQPMQRELPFWLTIVSPRSSVKAGELGAGFLTNFMGQSFEEVKQKIAIYRETVENHYGAGAGHVTVQVHTLLSDDLEKSRQKIRKPLYDYFRASFGLKNATVQNQSRQVDLDRLSDEDMEYVFSGAYKHYVHDVGLIGTPDHCSEVVDRLIDIGVDEICCLVDFGVDVDLAMESLHYTNVLRQRYEPASERGPSSENPQRQASIHIQTVDQTAGKRSSKVRNLPMTEGQKQLWALAQISDDANGGYNESIMLDMRGPFDVEAMRRSLQQIVDRHEALRITFDRHGEYQCVHPAVKANAPLLDLSHLAGTERQTELDVWSAAEMSKPFNLAQGPLFRFRLARLDAEHHVLVFTYHHTIVDGQSVSAFVADLNTLYSAHCQGQDCNLPAPQQFSDYLGRQAERPPDDASQANEDYWVKAFEGELHPLALPTDRLRPTMQTFKRKRYSAILGAEMSHNIYSWCRTKRCTGFLMMLAAFKVLLHKLTDQRDFIVAITTADSGGVNQKDLIGFRLNPLALRSRIPNDPTFSEFLSYVKGQMWDAFEHQDYSLTKLYRALNLQWKPGRLSPVSVKFHLDRGSSELNFHQLKVRIIDNPSPAPMFDLTLDVNEKADELLFRWNYNPDLFDDRTIQSWMRYLETLLKAIIDNSESCLSALPSFIPDSALAPASSRAVPKQVIKGSDEQSLTRYQQRIWAWQKLNHDEPIFNYGGFWLAPLAVDHGHLERAIAKWIQNNDALRTVIRERDGLPYQCVLADVDFKLERQDFSSLDDPRSGFRRWAEERCHKPYDLEKCPFDFVLAKLSENEYGIYFSLAHIVADGWSVTLTERFVSEYYVLSLNGKLDEIGPRPSFQQYVQREQEYLTSPRALQSEEYWQEKLAESIEPIAFYGRPSVKRTSRVSRTTFDLGSERSQRFREIAKDKEIFALSVDLSLFAVFSTILCAYLHRISVSRDLSLGVPFHNRRSNEETVGLFMHVLPLRATVDQNETFLSLTKKVRSEFIKVLRHSEYPVGNALQKQAYDVVINFINAPFKYEFAGQYAVHELVHSGYGHESLTIQVRNGDNESFLVDFETHCDVFDEQQRGQAIRHFIQVADSFLTDRMQTLRYVDVLTPEERQQILEGLNNSEKPFSHQERFSDLFEAQVRRTPDNVAITVDGQSLTYAYLNSKANALGRYLRSVGVGPDMVVALLAPRGVNFLTAMLAIFKAGAAYLPLDLMAPGQRQAQILSQTESPLVLVANECITDFLETLDLISVDQAPNIAQLDELLSDTSLVNYDEPNLACDSQPNNLSYVIYTSGSTGKPKGAMVEQQGMLNHLFVKVSDLQLDEESIVAQTAPQSFDISVWQFLAALLVGGRIHIVNDNNCRDPFELRRMVQQEEITIFETVPTMLRAMLEMEQSHKGSHDFSSLQWLLVTGEALPPDLCRLWLQIQPDIPLLNAYGPTECSDDVTHHTIFTPPDLSVSVMPIGRPVGNIRIHILDENLLPLPFDTPGEVCVGGVGVGRGYLKDSYRTAQVFVPNPHTSEPGERLYKTGDLGRYLSDGTIEFLGRIDHQVKIRGYRIELGEIEAHLLQHPAIREAAAVVREVEPGDKRLIAYLATHQNQPLTVNELRSYLEEKLPKYMIPSAFVTLGTLPLTANGKVNRQALPLPGTERPEVDDSYVAPQRPIEEALARIWRKVLHLEQVGVNDNFFELGGDSILAVQVAVRANQTGLRLAPMDIFEHQSIAELADWLSRHSLVQAEQGIITGPVFITPGQNMWLENCSLDPIHQAATLIADLQSDVDPDLLQASLQQLISHHDALRLHFASDSSGWNQLNAASDEGHSLARVDLSYLPESEREQAVDNVIASLQSEIDLSQGPAIQSAFLRFGDQRPPQLLVAIHPLVADDPSRHILLSDLQMAYQQLAQGESVQLPLKSTSFKQWSEKLARYAESEDIHKEIDYWLEELLEGAPELPSDYSEDKIGDNTTDIVTISVGFDEIEISIRDDSEPPALNWNNLSLTALTRIIADWTGSNQVLIDLHRNARVAALEDVDLSRTIGPLTTAHPICVKLNEGEEPMVTLGSIQRKMERVPNYGLGYGILRYLDSDHAISNSLRGLPQAEISFSYLDQIYSLTLESSFFEKSSEFAEALKCRRSNRSYPMEVSGCLAGGRLHFEWIFSKQRFASSTIENLAARFVEELRALIKLSLSVERGQSSGSDAVDFKWDQQDVDKVMSLVNKANP